MPDEGNDKSLRTIGQVVGELSTEFPDVTHSSLRFLEREGLVSPSRTAGGHRLFPEDQIDRIRTIKTWQRQRLSLEEIRERLALADALPDLDHIARQLLQLLVEGRRVQAQELLIEADDAGVTLEKMFDEVFRPVLHETGERWERGEIPVGQEKEISFFLRDMIAQLSARHQVGVEASGPTVIAACVEGEGHELGLRMITALLRLKGYAIHYLGPNVSSEFLIERIAAREPDAVLIGVALEENLASLERTIESIESSPEIDEHPRILVGGAGVSNDWLADGARYESACILTGPSMAEIAQDIESILSEDPDAA